MTMKSILVATDFSARSDRAIRRAILLAKRFDATISLVHVIDDDKPTQIVRAEQDAASLLLEQQARSLREIDGVICNPSVVLSDAFAGIAKAVEAIVPDLAVIGSHRRRALLDVFIGTTAERTIRGSRRPVLMANAVPAGFYRHVLVAVDSSESSGDAVRAVLGLGLDKHAEISLVHPFDAPGTSLIAGASKTEAQIKEYIADERARATEELATFLAGLGLPPIRYVLRLNKTSIAATIHATAREVSADLIVVGTRGRSGIQDFLIGSVAKEVLRTADLDVLAVPPRGVA